MSDAVTSSQGQPPAGFPQSKLQIGQAWPAIWRTFRQKPGGFYLLSAIPLLLVVVSFNLQFADKRLGRVPSAILIAITVIQYLAQFICQNAIIYGAGRLMSGERFTVGEALATSLRRFLPYLLATIVATILILIGFVLLIIPGFMAATALILVPAACVVEGRGPIASVKRSAALTKGNRWRVVGAILFVVMVPLIAFLVLGGIVFAAVAAIHMPLLFIVPGLIAALGYVLLLALWYIFFGVLFVELRSLKEGVAPSRAAQVFA